MTWGENDCCLVLADWVRERTGFDPAASVRGTYLGWKQAAGVWRRLGGVEGAVKGCLDAHFPRVTAAQARPGDVALLKTHHKSATCAIIDVPGTWAPSKTGFRLLQGFPLIAIWRIP